MYALIQNDSVFKYPYSVTDARIDNPNVSFPSNPSDETMEDFGVVRVYVSAQPEVTNEQILIEGIPVYSNADQRWIQIWSVRDKTAEEIKVDFNAKATEIREARNLLLSNSDWTQLADSSADKQSWAVYRQSLRDITSQNNFPWEVTWPAQPA